LGWDAFFGYHLDKWLDTTPIFFIIFFFLGVAAGALNIYKLAVGLEEKIKSQDSDTTED